jgi:hypothetical protein
LVLFNGGDEMSEIEGVPKGWRLVRIGKCKGGAKESYLGEEGQMLIWPYDSSSKCTHPIIERIEPQYRPFANAEEFKPFRDKWTFHPNYPDKLFRLTAYDDKGIYGGREFHSYSHLFECGTKFEDGSPFGMVVEE